MATKQTDAVAMTEEQLDTVVGGSAFVKLGDIQGGIMRKGSSVSINEDGSMVLSRRGRMGVVWPEY